MLINASFNASKRLGPSDNRKIDHVLISTTSLIILHIRCPCYLSVCLALCGVI